MSLHRNIAENALRDPLGAGPMGESVMRDIDGIVNNLGKTPFFCGLMGENDPWPCVDGGACEIICRSRGILKKFHRICVR